MRAKSNLTASRVWSVLNLLILDGTHYTLHIINLGDKNYED